jgi:sulfate adenylyltransferase subunit 1
VNDLGRITPRTAEPLALDHYADVRRTGAFLLVDPVDGSTPTAGTLPSGPLFPAPSGPQ